MPKAQSQLRLLNSKSTLRLEPLRTRAFSSCVLPTHGDTAAGRNSRMCVLISNDNPLWRLVWRTDFWTHHGIKETACLKPLIPTSAMSAAILDFAEVNLQKFCGSCRPLYLLQRPEIEKLHLLVNLSVHGSLKIRCSQARSTSSVFHEQ